MHHGESRRLLAPEEPVHTISVGQMPVGSKRHVSQIVQECFVGSYGKLVEDFSELAICSTAEVDADHVSLFGSSCGVQPVRCHEFNGVILQMGVDDFLVMLGRDLFTHGRVGSLGDRQIATEAGLVKFHGLRTVAIKQ